MNNGKLSCGLGNNRGTGGDHHSWMVNNLISKCDHTDRGTSGVGGCLYILSTGTYCVVNIDIPDGAKIVVDVTGDDVQPNNNYVDNNSSINKVKVNRLEKNGDISFIVRKGAKVSYTVTKDHYNEGRGNFIVGESKSQANLTVGEVDRSTNEQSVKITLNKTIFTHTITSSEANITVRGNFTDDTGKIISNSIPETGSVTFKVWSGDRNVSYTVSKQYYNTKTGTISVDYSGGTTNVTLDKTKYYINSPSYSHSTNRWPYRWSDTGRLRSDDGSYDNAYLKKNDTARINATVGSIPPNWTLYLDGCYVGTSSHTGLRVNINGTQRLSRTNLSEDSNNNYTINGSGAVNSIEIIFNVSADKWYQSPVRNFYLDSVYFIVND